MSRIIRWRDEGSGLASKRWFHADRQGSIIAVSDGSGNALNTYSYGSYGESPLNFTGTSFGYTGQRWVAGLSLYYYKARFYSPTLGRFLQTDPIGTADDMNMYAYTGADPLNKNDPSGLGGEGPGLPSAPTYLTDFGGSGQYLNGGYDNLGGNSGSFLGDANTLGVGPGGNIVFNAPGAGDGGGGDIAGAPTTGSVEGGLLIPVSGGSNTPGDLAAGTYTLSPGIKDIGIHLLGTPSDRLDHIYVRHVLGLVDDGSGTADPNASIFYASNTAEISTIISYALSDSTAMISANTGGRSGFIVTSTLPNPVGTLGGINGSVTNTVSVVVLPSYGIIGATLGVYQVWTAFPSRRR